MTTLPTLDVVCAGAGSGKTFRIKETIGQWVKKGLVQPDRIVAVTFTEAAAAELKERLRTELIDLGRAEDALKLDQSYISTIHSFGLRILTEFAFDGGMPPRSRLLDKNEETALLRQAIARSGNIDPLTKELRRYGYAYDGGTQTSAEEQFRKMVQKVIGHLRTAAQSTNDEKLAEFTQHAIKEHYGPTSDGSAPLDALHRAVVTMLDHFPSDISGEYVGNDAAVKEFRKSHVDLTAARDKEHLSTDWSLWQSLRKLRKSSRVAPTPAGYDELADIIIEAANELPAHPGPLQDAIRHAEILIGLAAEAIEGYSTDKRQATLVDYTDMVSAAHMILASESGALEALAGRVDCLVIDEFQDTNPLQFSLLWLLQRAGIPTLIVGDLKQAIMGFQGADPRLMEGLLRHEDASTDTLNDNWRTQPTLMPFINGVGGALFGDGYAQLTPKVADGFQTPLEILEHPKPPSGGSKKATRALRISERIKSLLDDPDQYIRDRKTEKKRKLRAGDIAILCPTNGQLQVYADALREFGVKAKVAEAGWLSSRIVQLAQNALEFVENPSDRHAALYLSCTEFGGHDLQTALADLIDNEIISDPVLQSLKTLQGEFENATVDVVLSQVIGVLDLYGRIATWTDPDKHRADLLRLEAEAKAFVEAKPETLASGGFFGSGVKTFLVWLNDKVHQDKEANQRPDPDATDTDAVEMVTWHRSKGREWPVVFVCGWDADVKPRLPKVGIEYENFDDLDAVLEEARVSFVPKFAAPETNDRFLATMAENSVLSAKRLIYVALTRARERLVLEWHSHLARSKRTTYHSVFQEQTGIDLDDEGLKVGDVVFRCLITENDGTPPDLPGGSDVADNLPTFGRRALESIPLPKSQAGMFLSPSSLVSEKDLDPPPTEEVQYGHPLILDMEISGAEYGTFIHRCFEILTSSPDAKSLLSEAAGRSITDEQATVIATSHDALLGWFAKNMFATSSTAEFPFSVLTADGSVCTGLIDLLIETPDGFWIIDYKTDRATDEGVIFAQYWPQLQAYREALLILGHDVAGVGLNLVNEGKLLLSKVPTSDTLS